MQALTWTRAGPATLAALLVEPIAAALEAAMPEGIKAVFAATRRARA